MEALRVKSLRGKRFRELCGGAGGRSCRYPTPPPRPDMTFPFSSVLAAMRSVSAVTRPTYCGTCPHCERTTPWVTSTLHGFYYCTECGRDAIKPDA